MKSSQEFIGSGEWCEEAWLRDVEVYKAKLAATNTSLQKNRADLGIGKLVEAKLRREAEELREWNEKIKKAPEKIRLSWKELGLESSIEVSPTAADEEIDIDKVTEELTESWKRLGINEEPKLATVTDEDIRNAPNYLKEGWKELGI